MVLQFSTKIVNILIFLANQNESIRPEPLLKQPTYLMHGMQLLLQETMFLSQKMMFCAMVLENQLTKRFYLKEKVPGRHLDLGYVKWDFHF